MTPEELETILRTESPERCTELLEQAAAHADKRLAKATVAIKRQAKAEFTARVKAQPMTWWNDKEILTISRFEARVQLAVLAFCSWTEAKRVSSNIRALYGAPKLGPSAVLRILKARKPDWLEQWVNKELEVQGRDAFNVHWALLRDLVREGLCPTPAHDNYIARMIYGVFNHNFTTSTGDGMRLSLKERLLADPGLLSHEIWRIFELVPGRDPLLSLGDITYTQPTSHPCTSWAITLKELADEGTIDRQRLLAASLGSLLRNTLAKHTAWFQKFHEFLEPTLDERAALQSSYLQLLSHPVPAVVGMALDGLAALDKAKRLDPREFLDAVGAVFHLPPKGPSLAALKILGRMKGDADLAPKLAEVLLAGLAHPLPPVQEAILRLLQSCSKDAAEVIASQLPDRLDQLAASLQPQARELLAVLAPDSASAAIAPDEDTSAEIVDVARRIPDRWRAAAGIDALLDALEGRGELRAAPFDPMDVPRLYDDQRVQPVGSLDELIERLTVAIEGLDDAVEFELLVDGLSRLCDQRPDDFAARTAPILARLTALRYVNGVPPISAGGLQSALCGFILRWCGHDVRVTQEERDSILGYLDVRLANVAARFRDRRPAPLLACPTHRQGWIEPSEMAQRLRTYERLGAEPTTSDFIQGILRLAPDGRAETLAKSADLRGKFAGAFHHALGGPLEETGLPAEVLIAAGRARAPLGDLTYSYPAMDAPDAVRAASYKWEVMQHPGSTTHMPWAGLAVNVTPEITQPDTIRDVPTSLLHPWRGKAEFAWDGQKGLNRWKGTVWPANLASYYAIGVRIHPGKYFQVTLLRQRATFLEPLFDPDAPFSEMAQVLLAACLNEQSPEVTGLGVDLLADLIRDGRCVGAELGAILGRLMPGKFLLLNRVGKGLETVGRTSILHADVCARIVQSALGSAGMLPKDVHHLLSPLLEWLSTLEQGVHGGLRDLLAKAGSGKTGALARKLLELPSSTSKRTAVLVEALRGRVDRAERWISASRE